MLNESELRDMLWDLCEAQARATRAPDMSNRWKWYDARDHALEQIVSAVNHDRDAIAAVMRGDDDPAVFFRRGNACVSWDSVPDDMRWVAVDRNGVVYPYKTKPDTRMGDEWMLDDFFYRPIAMVGHVCADWECLIFERPQPRPVVVAPDEWVLLDRVLDGKITNIVRDERGAVFASTAPPFINDENEWNWYNDGTRVSRVYFLETRFRDVPWRESMVLREDSNARTR